MNWKWFHSQRSTAADTAQGESCTESKATSSQHSLDQHAGARLSRASVAVPWITICGLRIRGRNAGSSIADSISCGLIVEGMADPLSHWHRMAVDQDRGGSP